MEKVSFKSLDKDYKDLILSGEKAMENSYSPYSNFPVGAALLTKSGQIFLGTNIENASYGLTICAERVAIFSGISNGAKEFQALAIVVSSGKIITSCGACRQVLFEMYESFGHDFKVLFTNIKKEKVLVSSVSKLLPNAFTSDNLK